MVYGTLVPCGPNEHVRSAIGGTWEKASVSVLPELEEEGLLKNKHLISKNTKSRAVFGPAFSIVIFQAIRHNSNKAPPDI